MSEVNNKVKITLGYTNTDFTRNMQFNGVSDSIAAGVKTKCKAVNASLAAGTAGGLSTFFRADDYDATDTENIVGNFSGIVAAQIDSTEVEYINLNE